MTAPVCDDYDATLHRTVAVKLMCKTLKLTFQTVALDYDLPDSMGATFKSAQEETWGASRQTI